MADVRVHHDDHVSMMAYAHGSVSARVHLVHVRDCGHDREHHESVYPHYDGGRDRGDRDDADHGQSARARANANSSGRGLCERDCVRRESVNANARHGCGHDHVRHAHGQRRAVLPC